METLLDPDTLYVVHNLDGSLSYGRTPDGIGMYWYEEERFDEAATDVCEYSSVKHFDTPREFDDFRYGPV